MGRVYICSGSGSRLQVVRGETFLPYTIEAAWKPTKQSQKESPAITGEDGSAGNRVRRVEMEREA